MNDNPLHNEKNKSESDNFFSSPLKTKIAAGYVLLFLLAASAIFVIYKQTLNLNTNDDSEIVSKEKKRIVNDIFSTFYKAEGGVSTLLIDTSGFNFYIKEILTARHQIDTLETLSDSLQKQQLDTVLLLLNEKEDNLKNLISLRNSHSLEDLYKNGFFERIEKEDNLKNNKTVEAKVVIKEDTVRLKKQTPRKNFFKRLSDVFFNPESADTAVEIRSAEYTIIDSLMQYYNPADSLAKILENIEFSIQNERAQLGSVILTKINALRENNVLITRQMNNVLREYEKEEFDHSFRTLMKKEETISSVSKIIACIAILAVLIILIFLFLIWKDITKSRLYREQLEEANRTTRKLLKNREKLMRTITHDIKAPLSSIIGYIELLNNSKLNERQFHYVENMKNSSEHLLHLISELLEFNQLNVGKIQLHPLPFNAKKLFEEILTGFEPVAHEKNLRLNFTFSSLIDSETIVGDPLRIRQITTNLLSNAIKYTPHGEIALTVNIFSQDADSSLLKICVSDTGIGISQANRQRIFQEYERIETTENNADGFGIGLSIVKRLVEIQEGEISVTSEEGKGSAFHVVLPLVMPKNEENKIVLSSRLLKILIIDDDKSHLIMMSEQLKRKGFEIQTCHNPFIALEMIEKEHFDIIFTDIQMPDLNGFEIIKRIRTAHFPNASTIPVIALSARADISISEFKEQGFSSFLNKPFSSSLLLDMIARFISFERKEDEKPTHPASNDENRFAKLLLFAEGEKGAEKAILQSFVNESKTNIENLRLFKRNRQLKEIKTLAHKMLPIFRMMNEREIVRWLVSLENERNMNNIDKIVFDKHIRLIRKIITEGERLLISNY